MFRCSERIYQGELELSELKALDFGDGLAGHNEHSQEV
jgi:hypothetical protein